MLSPSAPWCATVVTLFPEMFPGPLGLSVLGTALRHGLWRLDTVALRDHAKGKHGCVDAPPFGGGRGMVLRPDVVGDALEAAACQSPLPRPMIYLSPRGAPLTQERAKALAHTTPGVILLCGRFEGVDQRVIDLKNLEEISIGDYVLAGGEVAACVLLEACVRLLPGVLGDAESLVSESFENNCLEYPHYTKPRVWEGHTVPEVLVSGNHRNIAQWRKKESESLTKARRPDLLRDDE